MLVALDTNVLVYAEGIERQPEDAPKIIASRRLLRRLTVLEEAWVAPAQALAELHSVLVRRAGLAAAEASDRVSRVGRACALAPTTATALGHALALARDHHMQIFDAIILAAAAEAGCELLCSEDLHDGFAWRGVTIVNPFRASSDPRLAALTAE